jgi:hypothetical protein
MKRLAILFALALSVSAPLAFSADAPKRADKSATPATTDSAWLEKARAEYPLTTCVVTGEDLAGDGDMAEAKDFIFKQPGKPDRLIRFCCGKCQPKFERDPDKYLKIIDEAAAKATKH